MMYFKSVTLCSADYIGDTGVFAVLAETNLQLYTKLGCAVLLEHDGLCYQMQDQDLHFVL